jgi:hypothetical protein
MDDDRRKRNRTLQWCSDLMIWQAYLGAWSTKARAMLAVELTARGLAP